MAIKVIEADSNMSEEVCRLLIHSISEACAKDHHNDPRILEEWLANKTPENVKHWLETNRTYSAVSNSGEVLGVIQASSENRILLNYVDPNYLGMGIGSKLLQRLENEIGEGNLVLVNSTETAKPFYNRKGFTEVTGKSHEMCKRISL